MLNYLFEAYVISTIIVWMVFRISVHSLEIELNTYYYIPSLQDTTIEIYVNENLLSMIILFVPIFNVIDTLYCLNEDHLALLDDIAASVGAIPIESNDDNEK